GGGGGGGVIAAWGVGGGEDGDGRKDRSGAREDDRGERAVDSGAGHRILWRSVANSGSYHAVPHGGAEPLASSSGASTMDVVSASPGAALPFGRPRSPNLLRRCEWRRSCRSSLC